MTTRRGIALLAAPILLLGAAAGAETVIDTFTGDGPGQTPVFDAEGPWRIDWQAESEHPLLSAFYTNLFDADENRYLGFITQLRGTGSGSKLIRDGGTFRIGVSGNDVQWTIRIIALSEAEAAALAPARTPGRDSPVREQPPRPRPSKHVAAGSFIGWNAAADGTLELVTGEDGLVQVVTFEGGCAGLEDAETVLFVTPESGATEIYDSVLLDDGTRCYFAAVIPQYR